MKKKWNTTKELPLSEQPYEKCMEYGAQSLSDAELLAVLYEQEVRVSAVLILQNVFYVNFRDKTLPDCIRFPMQICVRSEELVR